MNLFDIFVTLLTAYITYKVLKNSGKSLENDPIDPDELPEKKEILLCRAELINNQLYVWNKIDNSFITQGKDIDEIVEYFIKYHPNKKIYLKNDNENEYTDFKEKFDEWKNKTQINR